MHKEIFNIISLSELYPESCKILSNFVDSQGIFIEDIDYLILLRFFDNHKFYIGITCDSQGQHWYVDVSEMQVDCVSSRDEAEILAITECFEMMEKITNEIPAEKWI